MSESTHQIVLAARPKGRVALDDFKLQEVSLPNLKEGEVLLKAHFLSLDPYMRGMMDDRTSYAKPANVGDVMPRESVCAVEMSRSSDFKPGDVVVARIGWQTKVVCGTIGLRKVDRQVAPISTYLGVLGMPGFTAYAGLRAIGKPAKGETVVVSAAAWAVGSLVGQLGRIAGARVVGIAGGPMKCSFLTKELGFDAAVDYRAPGFPEALAASCPRGAEVYFENVGGSVWQAVLPVLNQFARVPLCVLIAQYDSEYSSGPDLLPETMRLILAKRLTLRGYINFDFESEYYSDFLVDVSGFVKGGQVDYREHIVIGIENAPKAFIGMLDGENVGKTLVRLS